MTLLTVLLPMTIHWQTRQKTTTSTAKATATAITATYIIIIETVLHINTTMNHHTDMRMLTLHLTTTTATITTAQAIILTTLLIRTSNQIITGHHTLTLMKTESPTSGRKNHIHSTVLLQEEFLMTAKRAERTRHRTGHPTTIVMAEANTATTHLILVQIDIKISLKFQLSSKTTPTFLKLFSGAESSPLLDFCPSSAGNAPRSENMETKLHLTGKH